MGGRLYHMGIGLRHQSIVIVAQHQVYICTTGLQFFRIGEQGNYGPFHVDYLKVGTYVAL